MRATVKKNFLRITILLEVKQKQALWHNLIVQGTVVTFVICR